MHATTVAIDLAKGVFELAFADPVGRVLERKRLGRKAFSRAMDNRPAIAVVMEPCGSAHYWGADHDEGFGPRVGQGDNNSSA